MGSSLQAFSIIASDIGVVRYAKEDDASFCRRTAYSAARFWIPAFCMDDGMEAQNGISKQAISRRTVRWVDGLDAIRPGIAFWFQAGGDGVRDLYNRLIDIGDLAPNGFTGNYVATAESLLPVAEGLSIVTGFYDPTESRAGSIASGQMTLSGLATVVSDENAHARIDAPWWETDLGFMEWRNLSDYGTVVFADPRSSRWNINRSDVWTENAAWHNGMTLCRVESEGTAPINLIARKVKGRTKASPIDWVAAQRLFFFMREAAGNRATAKFTILDRRHCRALLPVGFVPGYINRVLDVLGWPVDDVSDRFNRVMRVEALPIVKELLEACSIGFEEASNVQ